MSTSGKSKEDPARGAIAPLQWPWALASPAVASSDALGWQGGLLRCWRGTSPIMVQPPLDHHYVVMHLGGAKRVVRRGDGAGVSTVAEQGSLTLVPAGTAFTWCTSGPIAFAHLYVRPEQLVNFIDAQFGLDGHDGSIVDRVGWRDPLLEPCLARMIEAVESAAAAPTLLLDSLLESILIRLARNHAPQPISARFKAVALAPHRLQRVLDFMEANLGRDIALADLVGAAGTSQYHFSHAFHAATGCSPYHYLLLRRIEYAKVLLMTSAVSLEEVARGCGFRSRHQFAVNFKDMAGVGPKRFRMMRSAAEPALSRRARPTHSA